MASQQDQPGRMNGVKRILPIWPALLILGVSIAATLLFWRQASLDVERKATLEFDRHVGALQSLIHERLLNYQQLLLGAGGLFAASREVSRDEWQAYVRHLKIEENYPSLVSVDFARSVKASDKKALVREMRSGGFPRYRIWPESGRPVSTAITLMEPFDAKNRQAFGYDMGTESNRRAALELARDTGDVVISSKIRLIQENGRAGFLIYAPVYRPGLPVRTVAERRSALYGFAYSPVLMENFLYGIVASRNQAVGLEVYDGTGISPGERFDGPAASAAARFNVTFPVQLLHHTWMLHAYSLPDFDRNIDRQWPTIVLLTGIAISVLLFLIILSLVFTRTRALKLAGEMTGALRQSEERYRMIFEKAAVGISHYDPAGKLMLANQKLCELLGYTMEELASLSLQDYIHPDDVKESARIRQRVIDGADESVVQHKRYIRKDGAVRWVTVTLSRYARTENDLFLIAVVEDVTDQRKTEERQRELSRHLQEVREQERKNIARDIHDELGGVLTAIKFNLSQTDGTDGGANAGRGPQSIRLIDMAIESMRRIITDLRPSVLDEAGLWAAIEWHVRDFEARTGICSVLVLQGPEPELRQDQATAVFRIAQELLTNVVKHAGAATVEVRVVNTRDEIVIQVEDDGMGITSGSLNKQGSYGLIGIRERAERFNGSLHVVPSPGGGTAAEVRLPLAAPAAD